MLRILSSGLLLLLVASSAQGAPRNFRAHLSGDQEVPPVDSSASGIATLVLNETQEQLAINVQLFGLDLDGNQTPGTDQDDVTLFHIHRAPADINGGVVFGFIGPNSDLNGDLVIDPVAGTVSSIWDLNEGNGTTLADELPHLFNEGLYLNVHTVANPSGEIRGQIVPEPASCLLLLVAAGLIGFVRHRNEN
jgi:hypothetical protein